MVFFSLSCIPAWCKGGQAWLAAWCHPSNCLGQTATCCLFKLNMFNQALWFCETSWFCGQTKNLAPRCGEKLVKKERSSLRLVDIAGGSFAEKPHHHNNPRDVVPTLIHNNHPLHNLRRKKLFLYCGWRVFENRCKHQKYIFLPNLPKAWVFTCKLHLLIAIATSLVSCR